LNKGQNVVLLSRRNSLPYFINYDVSKHRNSDKLVRFLDHVQQFFPEYDPRRITISTTHKYKGLENDAVIVLDALENSYPLIHSTWRFLRIFGDNIEGIEADERRLFYVAVTRARQSIAIITEERRSSPFLRNLEPSNFDEILWDNLPPMSVPDVTKLEICVYDAFSVKAELKKIGFRWDAKRICWYRLIPSDAWSPNYLAEEQWIRGPVRVIVRSEDDQVIYQTKARDPETPK